MRGISHVTGPGRIPPRALRKAFWLSGGSAAKNPNSPGSEMRLRNRIRAGRRQVSFIGTRGGSGMARRSIPAPAGPWLAGALRACALALAAAGAAGAQGYPSWAHHKDIYYDTSPSGAGVPGDVAAFPVLVRLDSAGFPFAEARGDGRDLRFSKPDGTPLPCEIDVYDSAAHTAAVWVLADTVKGNSKGALLRLYWGNPAAPATGDSAKVFTAANGFAAVWHLRGRYPPARANSVAGGADAVPGNYDSDEQTPGVIGFADSLDGGNPGDHLQTWAPFDSLSRGFTFSVWANPSAAASWARLMDFGNGQAQDNLFLTRVAASDSLRFSMFKGSAEHAVTAGGALAQNQWQLFAVTVSGKTARIYRNGAEIASGDLGDTIPNVRRQSNYLGRSNWAADAYFRGKLDEPEVSAAARGPDWIKLAYANQRPDQNLLSFTAPILCEASFGAPADTALPEGSVLSLAGTADCADQFGWSNVSGPPVRILDPEAKDLPLALPRVAADTAVVLRFSARFGDSVRTRDVRIAIVNAIPEPRFALPSRIDWNGRDSLLIRPVIANLAAIRASPFPDLNAAWTVSGPAVDTLWVDSGGLMLLPPQSEGEWALTLCLDNGGPPTCVPTAVSTGTPVALKTLDPRRAARNLPGYGADGRWRQGPRGSAIRFIRPGIGSRPGSPGSRRP